MSNRTALRMRVLPRFPARISGASGIKVEQDNLDLVVSPDTPSLVQVPSISNMATTFFQAYNADLDSYSRISGDDLLENIQDVIIGENLAGIDALTVSANQVPYYLDGDGTASTYTVSSFVRGVSDAADASAFRSDIGLGGAAVLSVGTTAGTVAAGDDSRITGAAQKASNLSDLANAGTARANLGLGGSATLNVGTSAGTVAAGDDSRIVNALQPDGSGDLPFDKVPAEAVVRLIEFDIRQSQFAGGAPMNGIDDDAPALQAAVDYAKTLGGRFTGGSAFIRIPSGIARAGSSITVTGATNVQIVGSGDGVTTLKGVGNFPIIYGNDPIATPIFRFGVRGLTIEGPGRSNALAHGVRLGPNNNCEIAARIWSCRRAISLANSWQTTLNNIRVDGIGGISCYDGLYLEDGDASVVENAVLVLGGVIQACERFGVRGESISGSKFVGLEIVGCGDVGAYFGDSPSGKDLKWFSWMSGLIDTCKDLLVVKRGSSTIGELMHFSGMWLGYANDLSPGVGIGVDFQGMRHCTFSADIIANVGYAVNLENCENIYLNARNVMDYDRASAGSVGVICNNTTKSRFDIGTMKKLSGSPSTVSFVEQGTSNYNLITGIFDGAVTTIGAQSNKTLSMQNVP